MKERRSLKARRRALAWWRESTEDRDLLRDTRVSPSTHNRTSSLKMTRTTVLLLTAACCLSTLHSGVWAWISPTAATVRSPRDALCCTATRLLMSSSSEEEQATPDLTGKIVVQRVIHRLSEQSDVSDPGALSIEERIRFIADPDRGEGYMKPVGRRTLILRDKNERELYRMDVHETRPTHNGFDTDLFSTYAMILYIASNPKLLKGRVMELESQLGLGGLLGTIALAGVLGENVHPEPAADDVFPNKEKFHVHMPPSVEKIVLTDAKEEMLNEAFLNVKNAGLQPHEVILQQLDWKHHHRISDEVRYDTILGCDLVFNYPTVKELARTTAYMLAPDGTFVHICPDGREDLAYLRQFLTRAYLMDTNIGFLKLQTHSFKYQLLNQGEPEEKLDEQELIEVGVRNSFFESLSAIHNPAYDGINGEDFFPMETGAIDTRSRDDYLERERGTAWYVEKPWYEGGWE